MIRLRHHRRARRMEDRELSITAFMNLMVILVPFLLITAVFSRTTLLEVDLPAGGKAGNASGQTALPTLSVEIHDDGFTVYEGDQLIENVPWTEGEGLDDLSNLLLQVKRRLPERQAVTVLAEGAIDYERLVQVMDCCRVAMVADGAGSPPRRVALFSRISLGETPRIGRG